MFIRSKKTIFQIILVVIIMLNLPLISTAAETVIINHQNWDPSNVDQTLFDAVRTKKMLFGHASIGGQIVEGLRTLASQNPSRYAMTFKEDPPALTSPALAFPYIGPNGNPFDKITRFKNKIESTDANGNVWGNVLDIAYFKFCYVDIGTNSDVNQIFTEYINSVKNLQAQYPNCQFIYFTVPLEGKLDYEYDMIQNKNRHQLNELIRNYVKQNGGYLYDLADLEAYDDSGVYQTFEYQGATYPKAWFVPNNYANDGWTTDDGAHLNSKGKEHLALAMWKLWVSVVDPVAVTGMKDNNEVPQTIEVSENYPNPFNPSTNFQISLQRPAHVAIDIYNILGKQVDHLDFEKLSSGTHVIKWNARALPSGVYFYEVKSDIDSDHLMAIKVGRMVLLK